MGLPDGRFCPKSREDITESSNVPYLGSFDTELLVTAEAGYRLVCADITNFTSIRIGDPIIIDLDNGGQLRTTVVNRVRRILFYRGTGLIQPQPLVILSMMRQVLGQCIFMAAAPIGSTRSDVRSL